MRVCCGYYLAVAAVYRVAAEQPVYTPQYIAQLSNYEFLKEDPVDTTKVKQTKQTPLF
jgi:hypothetical protein